MKQLYQKICLGFVALFGLLVFGVVASPKPAAAEGETYTWKDYRTIIVSGGDLKGEFELRLDAEPPNIDLVGEQTGRLTGIVTRKEDCTVTIKVFIYDNTRGARLIYPPPYPPSVGSGGTPTCSSKFGNTNIQESYNGKEIWTTNDRPVQGDVAERPEEKFATFIFYAPEPKSTAPPTITVSIKKADGSPAGVADITEPGLSPGDADHLPDSEKPISYRVRFSLEPGDYLVCATYVITECQPITKVKKVPLEKEFGTPYGTPIERSIRVRIEVPYSRPCGSSFNISPLTVSDTDPNGKFSEADTPAGESVPKPEEEGAICTVNGVLTIEARFVEAENGAHKICLETTAQCVDAEKKPGEELVVTIRMITELVAPDEDPVCSAGTGLAGVIAFIACPVTELIISTTEFIERNLIIPFLTVSPLQAGSPVYKLWESVRNIANVAFIIAFFAVIFSQATSVGISNYGIKRMLPRLALVAIGTNLSFFIVAFIIDAFNVFGAGISDLVMNAIEAGGGNNGNEASGVAIFAVTTSIVAGVTLAGALTSAGSVLAALFPIIGIVFLILVVAVLVLILRQMIIIILVVLSPLAFVAWLLPNTEKYFEKWRQLLIQLLMMYPLIVLLFATGKLFQAIISAGDFSLASGDTSQGTADVIKVFLGFFVAGTPLVFLPFIFTLSNKMTGRLFSVIRSRASKLGQAGYAKAGEARERMAQSDNAVLRTLSGDKLFERSEKREAIRKNRLAEYERAKGVWLAERGQDKKIAKRAAGIGGEEAITRAMARNQAAVERAEKEELQNATSVLKWNLKKLNIDEKTFVGEHLKDYLKLGKDDVIDPSTGQSIFKFSQNKNLMEAALNAAAKAGEVSTIEEARMSPQLATEEDQRMVDKIIRENDGPLKGSGGFHLATNVNGLGVGRMRNASGKLLTTQNEMRLEMEKQRFSAMANSGANSIANMRSNLIGAAEESLKSANAAQIRAHLQSKGELDRLRNTLDALISNPDTAAKTDDLGSIKDIRSRL